MSGSKVVICKDKDEMLRMCRAGLLLINYGAINCIERDWRRPVSNDEVLWGARYEYWPHRDFGYLVDDDDG